MEVMNSAAEFHDWERCKLVIGKFLNPIIADADASTMQNGEPKWKKGDVLGFAFETELGNFFNVGKNVMIEKSLVRGGMGEIYSIEHLGKSETSSGQPLTRFKVVRFDGKPDHDGNGWAEALGYHGEAGKKAMDFYDKGTTANAF